MTVFFFCGRVCKLAQHHATLCAMMNDTREQLIDREARRVAIKVLGGVKDDGVVYDAARAQEEAKVADVGFSTGRRTFKLICS